MKRDNTKLLILLLCALQVATLAQLHGVKNDLMHAQNSLRGDIGVVQDRMDNISYDVRNALEEQVDPILGAACRIAGEPDTAALTVPIAYELTPKELAADTAVTLVFGEERVPMQRSGGSFAVTAQRPLFETQSPLVEVTTNGLTRQAEPYALAVAPWQEVLPALNYGIHGGEGRRDSTTLQRSGTIDIDADRAQGFKSINLVGYADETEVWRERISPDGEWTELALMYDFDVKLEIEGEKSFVLLLEAVDEYGFLHRNVLDYWEPFGDEGARREFLYLGEEFIYGKNGELLYGPKYEKLN